MIQSMTVQEMKTSKSDNRKYLIIKLKTGRGGGSWATPHQRPRAFCMTVSGTGQLGRPIGSLVHNEMSGWAPYGPVGVGFWNRFGLSMWRDSVRDGRRCGPGAASLATAPPAAPAGRSTAAPAPPALSWRRVTSRLFLFVQNPFGCRPLNATLFEHLSYLLMNGTGH